VRIYTLLLLGICLDVVTSFLALRSGAIEGNIWATFLGAGSYLTIIATATSSMILLIAARGLMRLRGAFKELGFFLLLYVSVGKYIASLNNLLVALDIYSGISMSFLITVSLAITISVFLVKFL